ncbi:hypothetical protein ACB092_06G092400 [Castanea dentata]
MHEFSMLSKNSRRYSSFTNVLRENINLEDELFGVSENSPLLVEDSPLNDEVATSKKKSTRGINFSAKEDKLLVAAWLNTSVNLVYGNKQHKTTFYDKIAKYFKDYKTDSTRSISSLTTRWGTINRETIEFCGSLAKIEAKNESGTTVDDKIVKARELFKEIHGYFFQYEHCWLMLKDFPKWATTMPREDSRKEMSQTPDSIDQGGGEKVHLKVEKVCLQELKENEKIIMLDTSGMNEDQRTFYEGLKKEILAKQRSSRSLG